MRLRSEAGYSIMEITVATMALGFLVLVVSQIATFFNANVGDFRLKAEIHNQVVALTSTLHAPNNCAVAFQNQFINGTSPTSVNIYAKDGSKLFYGNATSSQNPLPYGWYFSDVQVQPISTVPTADIGITLLMANLVLTAKPTNPSDTRILRKSIPLSVKLNSISRVIGCATANMAVAAPPVPLPVCTPGQKLVLAVTTVGMPPQWTCQPI